MQKVFDRQILLSLGLIAALLLADAFLTLINISQLNESMDWVIHSEKVLNDLGRILITMAQAETAQRNYVIAGESRYLEPYYSAISLLPHEVNSVEKLTEDNPRQQERIPTLQTLITARLKEMDNAIAQRHKDFESARPFIGSDQDKKTTDAVREQVEHMRQEELSLLKERKRQSEHSYNVAVTTSLITVVSGLLLLCSFVFLLRRNLMQRLASAAALHNQREWYRTTLSSIGDSVIATDTNAHVTFLNPEAEKMTGWTLQEALNQPLSAIFHIVNEASRLPVINPVDSVIAEVRVVGLANHTILIARDGTEYPIADTAAPIRSTDGTLIGCILVFHDISQHRLLEKELEKKADMLIDRDRRKDEFLAMLAHELRNPLAPISNTLHILESPSSSPDIQREAVDIANRQVSHMVRLLDDLLDVSRIRHGKIALQRRHIDLCEVIQIALQGAQPLMNEQGHTLEKHVPECPIWVNGDKTRLAQLLGNLLNNAAKYTNKGGHITLEVVTQNEEVILSLRDNGIGISQDKMPYIFDMFMQVDSSMERSQGGLGIGLMLVKNIAQMHDGSVTVSSEGKGKGTVFTVKLPILEHGQKATELAEKKRVTSSRSCRILIVDDNEASAKTLGWMIEALGHEAQLAFDARTAIEKGHAYRPDVVLLDIGLPDMNGYEVCREMRKDPVLEHTVFIAQTGWGQEQHLKRSKEAGFDFHLTKPISLETLQQQLEIAVLRTS